MNHGYLQRVRDAAGHYLPNGTEVLIAHEELADRFVVVANCRGVVELCEVTSRQVALDPDSLVAAFERLVFAVTRPAKGLFVIEAGRVRRIQSIRRRVCSRCHKRAGRRA